MTTQLEFCSPLAPPLPLRRFSVVQYHQLGELGVLTPEDNVELLEGWIIEKMNQRPIHGYIVRVLQEWLQSRVPEGFIVQCQLPITTARSEPEPDIAIIKGVHHDFRTQHPNGADCCLVIEVADTSLLRDRAKAAIYLSAGVAEFWIVNITDQCIERYQLCADSLEYRQTIVPASEPLSIRFGETALTLDLGVIFC